MPDAPIATPFARARRLLCTAVVAALALGGLAVVVAPSSGATTPVPAPGGVIADGGDRSATVYWYPPSDPTAGDITGYRVYDSTTSRAENPAGPSACTVSAPAPSTPVVSCIVSGLTNGTLYYFTVVSVTASGTSPQSYETTATPGFAPGDPTNLTATAGRGQVSLSWTAPTTTGTGVLRYRVQISTSPGDENDDPCDVTVTSCVVPGLTNGTTYYFTVYAYNNTGASYSSNEVEVTVGATVAGAPTAPTASLGNGQVSLSWTAPTSPGGATITGYKVFQSTTSGGENTAGAAACSATATSCAVTGLTNGTAYYFKVVAVNSFGQSAASSEITATPLSVPGAPTGLTATRGNGQATLSWTAPSSNGGSAVTGYQVFRSTTAGGENSAGAAVCSGTSTTCVVTALTNGATYYFTVVALNVLGQSAASNEAAATPATTPGAPTGLTATRGDGRLTLSWTAPTSNGGSAITEYRVFGAFSSGTESDAGTALCDVTTTSCIVPGLTNGTPYYFVVEAVNAVGHSVSSTEVTGTPATVPGAPSGLSAVGGIGRVTLTWSAPASNGGSAITRYNVFASSTSGGENTAGSAACVTPINLTACVIDGLSPGVRYYFVVDAVNAAGASGLSTEASAAPATVPGAPTGLTATRSNGQLALSWTAPASNGGSSITGYDVFLSTTSGGENTAGTPACVQPAGKTSCQIDGLTNGSTYYFVVEALNAVGPSGPSNEASGTPATVPDAPTGLTAARGDGQVALSWTAPASNGGSAITEYQVFASQSSGAESLGGTAVCDVTATSCVVPGLANGTRYFFVVAAVNAVDGSAASNEVSATPGVAPGAPTGVKVSPAGGKVTVAWARPAKTGSAALTGYRVYVATAKGGEKSAKAPSCTATSTSCTVTGLTNGRTYWFSVTAVSSAGESPLASPDVSAVPGPRPTIAVSGGHPAVAYGSTHKFTGTVLPHAVVVLYRGTTKLAAGTASSTGAYSFTAKVTVSGSYSVLSDGQYSATLAVHVVKLTLAVSGSKPYRKGTHTISGAAPAGQSVALVEDGKTVAKATAGSSNTYRFTRSLTGRHTLHIVCDGVQTSQLTITAS